MLAFCLIVCYTVYKQWCLMKGFIMDYQGLGCICCEYFDSSDGGWCVYSGEPIYEVDEGSCVNFTQ